LDAIIYKVSQFPQIWEFYAPVWGGSGILSIEYYKEISHETLAALLHFIDDMRTKALHFTLTLLLLQTPLHSQQVFRNENNQVVHIEFPEGRGVDYIYSGKEVVQKRFRGFGTPNVNGTQDRKSSVFKTGILNEFYTLQLKAVKPLEFVVGSFFDEKRQAEFFRQAPQADYANFRSLMDGTNPQEREYKFFLFVQRSVEETRKQASAFAEIENLRYLQSVQTLDSNSQEVARIEKTADELKQCNPALSNSIAKLIQRQKFDRAPEGSFSFFTVQLLQGQLLSGRSLTTEKGKKTNERITLLGALSDEALISDPFFTYIGDPDFSLKIQLARSIGEIEIHRMPASRQPKADVDAVHLFSKVFEGEEWKPFINHMRNTFVEPIKEVELSAATLYALDAIAGCI
jgi:hypothetical protein